MNVFRKAEFICCAIEDGQTLAAHVAKRRSPLRMTRAEALQRFPDGIGHAGGFLENSSFILCLPIISGSGEIAGVIELHRSSEYGAFTAEEEEIANSYLVWGNIAFTYADMNVKMNKQKKLNDFLLNVVKQVKVCMQLASVKCVLQ
jgi:hypothetical protein